MTALIFKFNLTDQQWCDNRTIEEALDEVFEFRDKTDDFDFAMAILRGDRYLNPDETVVYALSKSAIEEYIKDVS